MVDPNQVTGNTASERHSVKLVRANPPSQWKPVLPFKPSLAIAGATVARQILGVKAQPREEELIQWTLQTTMLLGLITWLVLLWFVCRWATGCCSRALLRWRRQEAPQPEHEPSESEEEPVVQTPPVAVENLFRTPVWVEPPRDLRPPAPEPEPLDGEAGAAAEAAEPAQEEPAPPPVAVAPQGQRVRRRAYSQELAYRLCRSTTTARCTTRPRDAQYTFIGTVWGLLRCPRATSSSKISASPVGVE